MKNVILMLLLFVFFIASVSQAANVGFDLNVNVGNRGGGVAVPVPVAPAPQIIIEEPPLFLAPPSLGFSVAVGIPYDMVYISGNYYLHRDHGWYRSPYYNGPWHVVKHRHLPPGLRKHKFERVRYVRDEEYRRYREDEGRYRGRHFRPDKERKEHRREERRERKEEKRWEKEERKQHKHGRRDDD
ncbi:MAG: hypothetical protein FD174_1580 [Geobacteraceae bacterium]|nr:MAG: hypothetical protein FD174_1580 [Geobacteraceae bacterium]